MSIITFIIIIAVLVFVHELGHFLFAKRSGIRVDEFAIGFPPKIFSWKKGETKYTLNLIPFGGYVKIFGENPDEESINGPDKKRSFVNKPKSIQAAVLIAGILFNIIFAWMLFSASFFLGVTTEGSGPNASLVITDVIKDSPADTSGFKVGDVITSLSLAPSLENKIIMAPITPEQVKEFIGKSEGKEIAVTYKRGDKDYIKNIKPLTGVVKNTYAIGIQMAEVSIQKLPIHLAVWQGAKTTVQVIKETTVGLYDFISKIFMIKADLSQVAGPVGIVGLVGQASQFGFGYLLSFTALISVNLAIINLIPFPALDGGRLLFVGIEAIRRKAISPKVANAFNLIGFGLLILLMLTVTYGDIMRLFGR